MPQTSSARSATRHKASRVQLAFAWFAGPTAWAAHLGLLYTLAGWACARDARWTLYAISAASLLLALGGVLASLKIDRHKAVDGRDARPFFGRSGLWLSLLFGAVILLQSVPILIVRSCQ